MNYNEQQQWLYYVQINKLFLGSLLLFCGYMMSAITLPNYYIHMDFSGCIF